MEDEDWLTGWDGMNQSRGRERRVEREREGNEEKRMKKEKRRMRKREKATFTTVALCSCPGTAILPGRQGRLLAGILLFSILFSVVRCDHPIANQHEKGVERVDSADKMHACDH